MNHPRNELDEVIHAPVRFSIVAALAAAERADFRFVRDTVEITDSALSKQVTVLENAGYVRVEKSSVGRRPRTYLSLTAQGHAAFQRHLRALRAIAEGQGVSAPGTADP